MDTPVRHRLRARDAGCDAQGGAAQPASSARRCSWCGEPVEAGDGYRAGEEPGGKRACFCRLEHVVPWCFRGPRWEPGALEEPQGFADGLAACAHCGAPLGDARVLLVRHRGEHRIPDAFCSAEHLAAWAKSGGRWG